MASRKEINSITTKKKLLCKLKGSIAMRHINICVVKYWSNDENVQTNRWYEKRLSVNSIIKKKRETKQNELTNTSMNFRLFRAHCELYTSITQTLRCSLCIEIVFRNFSYSKIHRKKERRMSYIHTYIFNRVWFLSIQINKNKSLMYPIV